MIFKKHIDLHLTVIILILAKLTYLMWFLLERLLHVRRSGTGAQLDLHRANRCTQMRKDEGRECYNEPHSFLHWQIDIVYATMALVSLFVSCFWSFVMFKRKKDLLHYSPRDCLLVSTAKATKDPHHGFGIQNSK